MTEKPLSARLREIHANSYGDPHAALVELIRLLPAIADKLEEAEQYVAIKRMEIDHAP